MSEEIMGYDPFRAFLGGVCDTLTRVPPTDARRFAPIGWPAGPELSERALAEAFRDLADGATAERVDLYEQRLATARTEDDRRLGMAVRLSFLGQWVGFALAIGLIVATGALALAGHDVLAFGPIVGLLLAMVGARVWLDRQPDA